MISNCQPKAFKFKDTASQTDGTLQLVNGNVGTLQCGEPSFDLILNKY